MTPAMSLVWRPQGLHTKAYKWSGDLFVDDSTGKPFRRLTTGESRADRTIDTEYGPIYLRALTRKERSECAK